MIIRAVTTEDVRLLQQIGRQTFYETFSGSNTEENMKRYLDENFSYEKLSRELNDDQSEFYFVLNNHVIIGYVKINMGSAQTEIKDDISLEIERIYVLNKYHGHKVGQLLFEYVINIAHEKGLSYVWLGVWEENKRAIGFYKKNGFTEFDKHVFKLGNDEQTDIMMKLSL